MAQTKVKRVQGDGSYQTKNGFFYQFEYEFEDGIVGLASHKTNEPKYKKGDSVNYEIKKKDIKGNNRIGFIQEQQFSNFKSEKKTNKSFALSYAKDLVIADKLSIEKIIDAADEFNNWMNKQ
tara:strand:+ start:172 stop:537 length:366 start_codon:yes stop_codon:yes gene_type:complete